MARAGIAWQRLRYPRPEAGGEAGAYRLRPSEAPRGRVLAAHGAGSDALFPMLGLLAPLVRAGFEVFAFDADGSGWDCTTRLDPAAAQSSVAAALAQAARGEPELPTHLLGYSLGGTLLLPTLADPPPYVCSAALLAAPLHVCFGVRSSIAEMLGFLTRHTLREVGRYGAWGVLPAAGRIKRRDFPYRIGDAYPGAFGYVDAVEATIRAAEPERAAARARVPVLLAYGEGDALVPASQGERLAALIPHAHLLRVPRASHWNVPIHPLVAQAVSEWVIAHNSGADSGEETRSTGEWSIGGSLVDQASTSATTSDAGGSSSTEPADSILSADVRTTSESVGSPGAGVATRTGESADVADMRGDARR